VIGGGFSGLAAAVELTERGHQVVLLERRARLGGRAYSFLDSKTGDTVDNGQHLFMRCYHHTITFLTKIGCLDNLKFQERTRVDFLDRTGQASFACPPLPAPLHLVAGLMRMKGLTLGDKLAALRVGRAIKNHSEPQTVAQWLDGLSQSDRVKKRFWYPMAIATLNEQPDSASAKMLKKVLLEAFGADRKASCIGIARVGLSDLYTVGAQGFIESHGGQVFTNAQVGRLLVENGRVGSAEMKDGRTIDGDFFISAVTHDALRQILPPAVREREFTHLAELESSPIVSINLWFDRPIIDREFVGLLGTRVQWLFNKDLIMSTGKQSNHIALIISAARGFINWTKETLVDMALVELNELIPESRSAKLLHSAVVKEREATIAHTVASDLLRPGQRTSIPNLVLAGDWVNTGLPATIESAVLSGHTAARLVHEVV
jgi:squalene-associated FAD-dependent desaturase